MDKMSVTLERRDKDRAELKAIFCSPSMVIPGVGKDAPIAADGKQSYSPYRLDLVDPQSLLAEAAILKEGAEKYGEDNWRDLPITDHLNHLLVHVYAYLAGDRSDDHLGHAVCRARFAHATQLKEGK